MRDHELMQTDLRDRGYLTRKQAAAYLGISLSTLVRRHRKNKGPALIRDGGKIKYRRQDLDTYLNVHCREDPWETQTVTPELPETASSRSEKPIPTEPSASPPIGTTDSGSTAKSTAEAQVSRIERRLRQLATASGPQSSQT